MGDIVKENSRLQRIRVLKGMLKLMIVLASLSLLVLFIRDKGGRSSRSELVSLLIDLESFKQNPAYLQLEQVKSRPLLIVKRTQKDIACLRQSNTSQFTRHKQPPAFDPVLRSQVDDWFIAWAQGTDMGCLLQTSVKENACRGLQDTCRGSHYDLAGRVYKGQYANKALKIPNYNIVENADKLVLQLSLD